MMYFHETNKRKAKYQLYMGVFQKPRNLSCATLIGCISNQTFKIFGTIEFNKFGNHRIQ